MCLFLLAVLSVSTLPVLALSSPPCQNKTKQNKTLLGYSGMACLSSVSQVLWLPVLVTCPCAPFLLCPGPLPRGFSPSPWLQLPGSLVSVWGPFHTREWLLSVPRPHTFWRKALVHVAQRARDHLSLMGRDGEERNRVPHEVPGPLEAKFSLGGFGGSRGQVFSYRRL